MLHLVNGSGSGMGIYRRSGDSQPVLTVYRMFGGSTSTGLALTWKLLKAYAEATAFSGREPADLTLDELFACTKNVLDDVGRAYPDDDGVFLCSGISRNCHAPEDVKKRFTVSTLSRIGVIGICPEDHASILEGASPGICIHLDTLRADVDGLFVFEGTEKDVAQINAYWDLDPDEDEGYITGFNDLVSIDDPGCENLSAEDIEQLYDALPCAGPGDVRFVRFQDEILSLVEL